MSDSKFAASKIKNLITVLVFSLLLVSVFLCLVFAKDAKYSKAERRPLETRPKLSYEKVENGEFFNDFEDYALDQFVFRDLFRSLKAIGSYYLLGRLDNNDLYYYDSALYKIERMNESSFQKAGEKIEALAKRYEALNAYYAVIPDKNTLIADQSGRIGMDMKRIEMLLAENITSAEYVDIASLLSASDYYKTDLHWRQDKLLPIADKLLLAMNNGYAVSQDSFSKHTVNGFYGAYYGQAALPLGAETLTYLSSAALDTLVISDLAAGTSISLYDESAIGSMDPYNLFLGGVQPLIRIENKSVTNGKKLYLFRDSFSSSLAPLLVGGYSEIYLIDIRYVMSDYLDLFLSFEEGQDILFLYSTEVLNNSTMLQ